jgi:hypothetical protein
MAQIAGLSSEEKHSLMSMLGKLVSPTQVNAPALISSHPAQLQTEGLASIHPAPPSVYREVHTDSPESNSVETQSFVKIRLRISSSWSGGKYAALRKVAFRTKTSSAIKPIASSQVKVRVQVGLEQLPSAHEVVRSLTKLLTDDRVDSGHCWKGKAAIGDHALH